MWRSDGDASEVVMVNFWDDRAAFRESMRSREHRVSHDRIPDELQQAITLQRPEHLYTYDVVAR